MSCKVLFIYPNQRAESLVPPSLAMFSSLLKAEGHQVDLFDSSNYDLDADEYINFSSAKKILNLIFHYYFLQSLILKSYLNAVLTSLI